MSAGYYPDHNYALRRLHDDDGLDPIAAYYLMGRDLYRAQQMLSHTPTLRFNGDPVGRVELNNSLEPFQVMAGAHPLGAIELAEGVYTTVDGTRYLLQRIADA